MPSFSIVIITYNEEENIGRCLDSILSTSDDIIVVDAYSTDQTVDICRSKGVRVISNRWEGYGAAKNYGTVHAKNDWIFSIDADEVCSTTLAESLTIVDLRITSQVYAVKRINHIGQRRIKFSHLHPEWKPRLFNKGSYKWDNRPVHELLSPTPLELIQVEGELYHFSTKSITELESSYERYAKLQAQYTGGNTKRKPVKYLSAIYHFVRSYVMMLGFLEGYMGYRLAIARSKAALIKYM